MTSITAKGIYQWRVMIAGENAQCVNCYVRVVPTGNIALPQTIMVDLSTNFYGNQLFGMGKFNVFVKSNYPFFKYYLADDY